MKKTYCIAELGINANGSVELAKRLIDKAYGSGCNAIKLQKRTVEQVYTKEELDKPRQSPWGTTTREQKNGIEFSIEQYIELEKYSKEKGLDFIVSCWDENSLNLIEEGCDVKYHKVASALLTDKSFLNKINQTGRPVILSTGMSSENEIYKALSILKNVEYVLACTSTYPTKDEEINLKHIITLKEKYPNIKIGFSNHSSGHLAMYGAVALGAECIEFHITHDRTDYGSDQAASIENTDKLISGIRKMEKLLGTGKKEIYPSEVPIKEKLRKVNNI
jgi:N-acetylneuraminate synthase